MGLVTLLAVSLFGAAPEDAAQGQGAAVPNRSESEASRVQGEDLVVDTSAVLPPLRVAPGSIDGDKVREVVSTHRAALRSCYERAVFESPTLSGTCTVRIVVDKNGTVGSASIHASSLRSLSMHRCVLQLVRTWRFPPPADGKAAAIEYPLVFRKHAPDAGP
jgi:TonB family protein